MKYFNPLNQEYVAPFDLNIAATAYSNLQQRHDKAIELYSKLDQSLAQLDLNEAEDGWREQKRNEVLSILNNGTIDGLHAFSGNDLIKASSKILFGADTIGRLKAQQEYKNFQTNLDKMNIPEHYKDNYKKMNPYHYEDKFDDNGNIIGGSKWEPNKRPVNSIDTIKLFTLAAKNVAAKKGSGVSVIYKDANGNDTTDISKSADGVWYAKRGTSYEALPLKDIEEAINLAITMTPGAEESIKQDWEMFQYDNANSETPIVREGFTDKNGNAYSYNMYKKSMIHRFADTMDYNYTTSDIDFNRSYNTDVASARTANNGVNTDGTGIDNKTIDDYVNKATEGGHNRGLLVSDVNPYTDAVATKQAANKQFGSLIKEDGLKDVHKFIQFMWNKKHGDNKNITYGPYQAVKDYIEDHPGQYTPEEELQMINAAKNYVITNMNLVKLQKGMSNEDKEKLRFSHSLYSGEFVAGNSRYDDEIIKGLNNIREHLNGQNAWWDIDADVAATLASKYNKSNLSELPFLNVSMNSDGIHVEIADKDFNNLPEFITKLNAADEENTGFWRGALNFIGTHTGFNRVKSYNTNVHEGNDVRFNTSLTRRILEPYDYVKDAVSIMYNDPWLATKSMGVDLKGFFYRPIDKGSESISYWYNRGVKAAQEAEQNQNLAGNSVPVVATNYGTLTELVNDNRLARGEIKREDKAYFDKVANEQVDRFFTGPNVDTSNLFRYEKGRYTKDNSEDLKALIKAAYLSGKPVSRSFTPLAGVNRPDGAKFSSPNGYALDIYIDKDLAKATGYDEGKTVSIVYAGLVDEGTGYDYGNSIAARRDNAVNMTKRSGIGVSILDLNNYTQNTEIQYNNTTGKYSCNYAGAVGKVDENDAKSFAEALLTLEQLNYIYKTNNIMEPELFKQAYLQVAGVIHSITGLSEAASINTVQDYIMYNE